MTWGKLLCTWCESEAITTVVQMKACRSHHDEYHRRRQAGEEWVTIQQDFWRRRWANEDKQRAQEQPA
jgi:hypothetical protein